MPEGNNHNNFTYRDSDHSIQFHHVSQFTSRGTGTAGFLLDQFNQNPDLLPSEILVVCPQVQNYSALIKSVFDNPESNETKFHMEFVTDNGGMKVELLILFSIFWNLLKEGQRQETFIRSYPDRLYVRNLNWMNLNLKSFVGGLTKQT